MSLIKYATCKRVSIEAQLTALYKHRYYTSEHVFSQAAPFYSAPFFSNAIQLYVLVSEFSIISLTCCLDYTLFIAFIIQRAPKVLAKEVPSSEENAGKKGRRQRQERGEEIKRG